MHLNIGATVGLYCSMPGPVLHRGGWGCTQQQQQQQHRSHLHSVNCSATPALLVTSQPLHHKNLNYCSISPGEKIHVGYKIGSPFFKVIKYLQFLSATLLTCNCPGINLPQWHSNLQVTTHSTQHCCTCHSSSI